MLEIQSPIIALSQMVDDVIYKITPSTKHHQFNFTHPSLPLRWVQVRCIELQTHDGMAPFPKHLSWVRNGILVVGLDNEMQIYSQWPDFNNAIAADCVVGEDGGGVKKEETKDVTVSL